MDEEYWKEYRKRARKRANAYGTLILGPFIIVIAVISFLAPNHQVPGDFRDAIAFRLALLGFFLALGLFGLVSSIRWLLADRRRSD